MAKITVMDHPLIQHKITILRSKDTPVKEFRALANEIALLMGYEATRDRTLRDVEVETPLTKTMGKEVTKDIAVIPILRAGLGMVDAMLSLFPAAKVGHIGLYRDPETHMPVEYYCKLPTEIDERTSIVVDPMLATGGSAAAAIESGSQHRYGTLVAFARSASRCYPASSADRGAESALPGQDPRHGSDDWHRS